MIEAIQVFRREDVPDEYRAYSFGATWVAVVSAEYESAHWIKWLQEPHFGKNVVRTELDDGTTIYAANDKK